MFTALAAFSTNTFGSPVTTISKDTIFYTAPVLKIIKRVGDWQLNSWKTNGFTHKKTDWTNAALYTAGLFELSRVSKDDKYDQALIDIGNDVGWEYRAATDCLQMTIALGKLIHCFT